MSKLTDEKLEMKARLFITGAKDEFKKFIPRDTVTDVDVSGCVASDGCYEITGSVAATSPTGKLKTFGYAACVNVDADGKCSLAKLQIDEL